MEQQVVNNAAQSRFEWVQDGLLSMVEYRLFGNEMVFTHTEVPPQLEGKGIAGKMAKFALEYAKEHNLTIIPLCPYIKAYVERHPEYKSMVKE